jgi:hypothetical protein
MQAHQLGGGGTHHGSVGGVQGFLKMRDGFAQGAVLPFFQTLIKVCRILWRRARTEAKKENKDTNPGSIH